MNDVMQASHDLLAMVHTLLKGDKDKVTTADIRREIERLAALKSEWRDKADHNWITEELIKRFHTWSSKESALIDMTNHEEWLTPTIKNEWRFWHRYRTWQERKLPGSAVEAIDRSTDKVLGSLENPRRDGRWDRRGLVVGHVQSGKTANYTGLICKAADAGYKIIIVLAGLHNNLRAQTQMRLDEGFLGYETNPSRDKQKLIGVGEIDPTVCPNFVTTRLENGDFSARLARNIGITPEERPWLFVVKKNKSVLNSLLKWLTNHVADTIDPMTGQKIITKLPLLVVDDEADNASVDTGEQEFTAEGLPDKDHEPKAINSLIRRILKIFSRKAYVGYTATPFANIFIHDQGETEKEGPDLFPSAFIVNLGTPSNYIGPTTLFGRTNADGVREGLPVIREVYDYSSDDERSGWMPTGHKKTHIPGSELPQSLVEAIDSFILACAIRNVRGQGNYHTSMLVHVTRFNDVQRHVKNQIEFHLRTIKQRLSRHIDYTPIISRLKSLWEADFVPVNAATREREDESSIPETWDKIEEAVFGVIQEIEVREINGRAKEALDYADSAVPLKVIAIGGDKLARGLTLEGLCTSYFLRASRMYDTLMQMGRWFGYRPGYLDLCRLYTTADLVEWFGHIAAAAEELREEFEIMAEQGSTPEVYGLKVKSHPVLMVTSPIKMRKAKDLYLSFSGNIQETVTFINTDAAVNANIGAFSHLITALGPARRIGKKCYGSRNLSWNGILWESVDWSHIVEFLEDYRTSPYATKANSAMLAEFIKKMANTGELLEWTVAILSGDAKRDGQAVTIKIADLDLNLVKRDPIKNSNINNEERYSIGRLLSPKDESLDLDERSWLLALEKTRQHHALNNLKEPDFPSGKFIREARSATPDKGLMLFYLIDRPSDPESPFVGFAISFPGSKSDVKVVYKANNVLWEREYAGEH